MDTTTTARNTFAARLYDQLAKTEAGKNLFLSPFSIQVALAMTAVGARGETRLVLADLIGAPESVAEQNRQYAQVLKWVSGDEKRPFQLVTANALWGQQGYHFQAAFQEAIADFYDGALHVVNLRAQPEEAVQTINAWVSDKTRAKIQELIHRRLIDQDTCLILTNAIYFKGPWEKAFEKAATRDEAWHGPNPRQVPMMHQQGGYLYYENQGFQALDLPYQGRQLSMLLVLPRKTRKQAGLVSLLLGRRKNSLTALERQLAAGDVYRQVTDGLEHEEAVLVSLPRFKLATEFELRRVLCALHADLAFSDAADFSGIGEEPLKISEVVHKAFVEVNEEGTEAAAATAVFPAASAAGSGSRASQPKVFQADHPFLFFIRDRKTNAVLFSGRLVNPQ